MRIALLGGTGDIGRGLAFRLARDTDHELVVGSRDAAKADAQASAYTETLRDRGVDATIAGSSNELAVSGADVAILAIPPYHVGDTVEAIRDHLNSDTVLVSPAVGMQGDEDGLQYHPPGAGSVAKHVADAAPDDVPVVCAFTNLAADRLADLDDDGEQDTIVVGDDTEAKARVTTVVSELDGIRALDAGPLANASEVESLTPLLINLARYNDDLSDAGIRFV